MFTEYRPNGGYDEYFSGTDQPRPALTPLLSSLGRMGLDQLNQNHAAAGALLKRLGATFRLNDSGSQGVERILPFDPLPRLIGTGEWKRLERGLIQRLEAIDHFLADVYGEGRIMADGVVPYDVNSPLWSDGTHKARFFALPTAAGTDGQPASTRQASEIAPC
jgi:uncharacterized circularly permuted ATP-grasp superfamily protein